MSASTEHTPQTISSHRQIFLIYLLAFVCAIGNPIILPSLPFIMADFQLSPIQLGMVISVYALPGACIIPIYGFLSDRLGRRPMLLLGLFFCGAGSLICLSAPSFFWLLVGRAMQGMSITPLEAMSNALASDTFEGEARMQCITRATAVQYFSVAVTPLIVSWLIMRGGWRLGFLFSALLGFGSFLLCLPIRITASKDTITSLKDYSRHLKSLLVSPRLLSLFSVRLGSGLVIFGAIYPHLSLLMADMGRPPEQVGFVFALYAAGMFAGALAMPFLIHCLSPRNIGLIGGMQLVLAMALILFTPSMHTLLLAMLMVGTGSGMLNSSCAGHVSLTATPDTRGSIMSAYSTIFRLGQSAAPVLFGAIYQTGSFSGVFTSGLAVAAVMTVIAAYSFACADRWEHPHLHN